MRRRQGAAEASVGEVYVAHARHVMVDEALQDVRQVRLVGLRINRRECTWKVGREVESQERISEEQIGDVTGRVKGDERNTASQVHARQPASQSNQPTKQSTNVRTCKGSPQLKAPPVSRSACTSLTWRGCSREILRKGMGFSWNP